MWLLLMYACNHLPHVCPCTCHLCHPYNHTSHVCHLATTCHLCIILACPVCHPYMSYAVQTKALQHNHEDVQEDSPGPPLRLSIEKVSLLSCNTLLLCTRHHRCAISCATCFRMLVLPCPVLRSEAGEEVRRYLAYITKDKV